MAHYLVTGGAGFIGSHLVRRLLERGDRVTIVDDLSTGRRENVPAGAFLHVADIAVAGALDAIDGGRIDGVLHLAAQSSGEASHADPVRDFDSNARGTFLLLEWCRRRQIQRVLYASSMAVYGPATETVGEDLPPRPVSYYGASKTAGEIAAAMFGRHGGKPTILRMFNVYGPFQDLSNMRQGMASIYLAYLLRGEPVIVKGSLDRYRDLVFIDDVVDAWVAALDTDATIGGTYNLGSGVRTTVRDLIAALVAATGHPPTYPVHEAAGTAGDLFGNVADITRLCRDTGWRPHTKLEDGLGRMAAWARQISTT